MKPVVDAWHFLAPGWPAVGCFTYLHNHVLGLPTIPLGFLDSRPYIPLRSRQSLFTMQPTGVFMARSVPVVSSREVFTRLATAFPGLLQAIPDGEPASIQLAFHRCYGDLHHKHFIKPRNTSLTVELANALLEHERVGREPNGFRFRYLRIEWIMIACHP